MITKIFRAVWFLSVLAVTGALLYGYASLPEEVIVQDAAPVISITRDTFFYIVLALLSIINVLVFIMARVAVQKEAFMSWFYGLIITINIFLIIAVSFVALYNSGETYDYARLELIIYASIAMFSCWTIGWPVYRGYTRFLSKS